MTTDLVAADKILYRDQQVMIELPQNTYPVKGEIYTLSSTHMIIDVDRRSVPVGFVPPEKGTEVLVSLHGIDCMYRVKVHLQEDLSEMDRMWCFERPKSLLRVQKRKYFRVPINLPLTISMTGGVGAFDNSLQTETVDISAGGVCFKLSRQVTVGQTLFIILEQLPGISSFPVLGDVVRCIKKETDNDEYWEVALNFAPHLPTNLADQLAESVAVLQRNYLKNNYINNR